jgi:hypothetical protein
MGIAETRWLKSLKRKNKRRNDFHAKQIAKKTNNKKLKAPPHISIYDPEGKNKNCLKTLDFIEDIKRFFRKEPCIIDFSETNFISAAALITIYAALETANTEHNKKSTIVYSKLSPRTNKTLRRTNTSKLIEGKTIKYSLRDSRYLPIVSSVGTEQMEEIIDFIQERIYKGEMPPDTEFKYGDAVSETINNVNRHAYPSLSSSERRWWLLCEVIGKKLYLAIYDTGVGIPKTIIRKEWITSSLKKSYPEIYAELLEKKPELESTGLIPTIRRNLKDAQLIHLSLKGDVSGTKIQKHGQGSKSIRALVSETEDGKLWVFSNKGLYTYKDNDDFELYNLPKKVQGTLVQWNIELP